MSEEELRAVWLGAGRPGVDKYFAAVLRSGLAVRRQAAQEFVKKPVTRQVFAPGPTSGGRVTASRLDDRWQADLIDWKQKDASKNEGYKYILVVVDVFFLSIHVDNSNGEQKPRDDDGCIDWLLCDSGRKPSEVDSDGGPEFSARFTSF
jgi:hypothetical protein